MKIKHLLSSSALVAVAVACASATAPNYTVTIPLSEDEDDMVAYIVDFDSGEAIDSTVVANGVAKFQGNIANPVMATVSMEGSRLGTLVLEPGQINVDVKARKITGTPINDYVDNWESQINDLQNQAKSLPRDSSFEHKSQELYNKYLALNKKAFDDNANNAFGYYLFLQECYDSDLKGLDEKVKQYPQFANGKRIAKLRSALVNKEETSVGHKFKDFAVTNDGKTQRLSDYVGKGKYTLVDFWASWCGPCRREMPNLVDAYAKYKGKNFEIVGVSLDQSADAWKESIKNLKITWPQMSDLKYWGSEGAQLYAVNSIPHTILIDGEGTIIARGLHGEGLQTKLAEVLK